MAMSSLSFHLLMCSLTPHCSSIYLHGKAKVWKKQILLGVENRAGIIDNINDTALVGHSIEKRRVAQQLAEEVNSPKHL